MATPAPTNEDSCGMGQFVNGPSWMTVGGSELFNPNALNSPVWGFYIPVFVLPVIAAAWFYIEHKHTGDTRHHASSTDKIGKFLRRRIQAGPWLASVLTRLKISEEGRIWTITPMLLVTGAIFVIIVLNAFIAAWRSMNYLPDYNPPFNSKQSARLVLGGRCTAHAGELGMALLLIPVTKNGLLVHTIGVPFDRAIIYHRYLGRISTFLLTFHGCVWWFSWLANDMFVSNQIYYNGWYTCQWGGANPSILAAALAWLGLACMVIFSVYWIRRQRYELFWLTHRLFLLVIPMAAYHSFVSGGYMVAYICFTGGMYVADLIFRIVRTVSRRPKAITLKSIAGDATMLSYPKSTLGDTYVPGQYCFICIPSISGYQWHPFSISSCTSDKQVTHHIKNMGSDQWTGALRRIANHHAMGGTRDQAVFVDGPYGNPTFAAFRCDALLLAGGGVGITPMMSIMRGIYCGDIDPEAVRTVYFDWTVRTLEILDWFSESLIEILSNPVVTHFDKTVTFKISLHVTRGSSGKKHRPDYSSLSDLKAPLLQPEAEYEDALEKKTTGLPDPAVGRPDYHNIVMSILEDIGDEGRLSIHACGPQQMAATVSNVALDLQDRVSFHTEVFHF